jgi:hypothetical protein
MNCKGFGRKRSRPNYGMCVKGLWKQKKTSVTIAGVMVDIRTKHIPNASLRALPLYRPTLLVSVVKPMWFRLVEHENRMGRS